MNPEDFREDVIARLARIETNQAHTLGDLSAHGVRITKIEGKMGKLLASLSFVSLLAGAGGHWVASKMGLV